MTTHEPDARQARHSLVSYPQDGFLTIPRETQRDRPARPRTEYPINKAEFRLGGVGDGSSLLGNDVHRHPDQNAGEEILGVRDVHADAAVRRIRTDRPRLVGAVDADTGSR